MGFCVVGIDITRAGKRIMTESYRQAARPEGSPLGQRQKGVSRKFLYRQQQKGNQALELGFNQAKDESEILYWIPVTKNWIFQVILALIFICHSSYRGVVELMRDLFDYQISVATVHNPCEISSRKSPVAQ